jgi:1,4-dihydroxy-6-naphthoate synthase
MTQKITLGHSPDPDDAFMFYAMASHQIPMGNYEFEHILQDIQTLNERAKCLELDVTAVSIHAYAYLTKDYALMHCGASMGDNYGPMLVADRPYTREEMLGKKIAVPGLLTSASLALQLYLQKKISELDVEVVPFDQIFHALKTGQAEVGLLIHEGQLTYRNEGFVLCQDLGQWWFQETEGLPLPLGGNVIRRSLGEKALQEITQITEDSIRFGLEHRQAGVVHALPLGRGLDYAMADRFIGMYVNDLTLDYGERGRNAVREFLKRGFAAGILPEPVDVVFI